MGKLVLKTNPKVNEIFAGYPDSARKDLESLYDLVIVTAEETEGVDAMEVTLKWGEPSFVTKHGSTELDIIFPEGLPPNMTSYVSPGEQHSFKTAPKCYSGKSKDLEYSEQTRQVVF